MILWLLSNYFVKGGLPGASDARLYLSYSIPFTLLIATSFLCILHFSRIRRMESGWYNSVVYWIVFVFMMVDGFAFGVADEYFSFVYGTFADAGAAAIMGICSIGITLGYFRTYLARSPLRIAMIIFGLLAVSHGTGVMQFFAPWLVPLYIWEESFIVGQAEFGCWLAYHFGLVALAARVVMGREKLRPE
jgi:hypothetical protein